MHQPHGMSLYLAIVVFRQVRPRRQPDVIRFLHQSPTTIVMNDVVHEVEVQQARDVSIRSLNACNRAAFDGIVANATHGARNDIRNLIDFLVMPLQLRLRSLRHLIPPHMSRV